MVTSSVRTEEAARSSTESARERRSLWGGAMSMKTIESQIFDLREELGGRGGNTCEAVFVEFLWLTGRPKRRRPVERKSEDREASIFEL